MVPPPVVHRWDDPDPTVGCGGNIAEYREFMAIFPDGPDGAYGTALLNYLMEMQLDGCNFLMGHNGFNLEDLSKVGGWHDRSYGKHCAACIGMIKRADGGIILKWSLSSDTAEFIDAARFMAEREFRLQGMKTIYTEFVDDDPFPYRMTVFMENNTMVNDNGDCGLNAKHYANFSTVYQGQGLALLTAVDALESDQCEFWMRKVINLGTTGVDGLTGSSAVCVGCNEVVSPDAASAELKWWISGSTKEAVADAENQSRQSLANPPTAVPVSLISGGSTTDYVLDLVSNTKTGEYHHISGPTCESTANARIAIITTFTGDADRLIEYWESKGMDQCAQWMKEVLDLGEGGWRTEDRVCTGCTEVKKGSAVVTWSISSVEQSETNLFRTKIEESLDGKQLTVQTDDGPLIIEMESFDIPGNTADVPLPNSGGDDDSTLALALGLGLGGFVLCVLGLAIAAWLWFRSPNVEAPREGTNVRVDDAALDDVTNQEIRDENRLGAK